MRPVDNGAKNDANMDANMDAMDTHHEEPLHQDNGVSEEMMHETQSPPDPMAIVYR